MFIYALSIVFAICCSRGRFGTKRSRHRGTSCESGNALPHSKWDIFGQLPDPTRQDASLTLA